jgi:hypothetical protein
MKTLAARRLRFVGEAVVGSTSCARPGGDRDRISLSADAFISKPVA